MSEKVVLPKEIAEAIEALRSEEGNNLNDYGIVSFLGDASKRMEYPKLYVLTNYFLEDGAKYSPIDLMRALVNGYEVEKSPEGKVYEYYTSIKRLKERAEANGNNYRVGEIRGELGGIETTLNLLGIKIEGVNA